MVDAVVALGQTLPLTEELTRTLQARLAPVLRDGPVALPDWSQPERRPDPCPLTQQLGDLTAHLLAITTTLHSLIERLCL
jgi:hypothetical protein